jgi:predicted alpha/beta superfamily hydrolase
MHEAKMEPTQHNAVNVIIIDEAFHIPQLDRRRRIWLYHPPEYNDTDKRYPVVYMHDAQNLFDDATAYGEEWQVDETLNSMWAECIIVGIDNSEKRLNEYNYNDHEEHGPGEGRDYMEFIINTLKPTIDENFRTKPEREHTYLAGSSMGGLISLYGSLDFPGTFGGAGVFSPSLWLVPDYLKELASFAQKNNNLPQRFYFYGGAKEGGDMIGHLIAAVNLLKRYPFYTVDVEINPEGEHSEYHWRNQFPNYYLWLAQGLADTSA